METQTIPLDVEVIKLIRGQRGNYGWEVKILGLDTKKLEELNNDLLSKFGGANEKGFNSEID